jgi:hypothetical protein
MLSRRQVVAAGIVLPGAAAAAAAPQARSRSRLTGAWSLIDAVTVDREGHVGPWEGRPGPITGLIVYEPGGTMSVQIANARQPLPHATDFKALPPEQRLPYLDSYYAYFGTYAFDAVSSTVTHVISSALDPSEIGQTYTRTVALRGDLVTLTTPTDSRGFHNVLRWRRVTSSG